MATTTTSSTMLSDGSLASILNQKNDRLIPLVQILGTKMMPNSRVRVVISDGTTMCQHCIFIGDDVEGLFNAGQLNKFTVVRLDQYTISSLPKKENTPVVLVNKVTVIKQGDEIDRKLNPGECFDETSAAAPVQPVATSNFIHPSSPVVKSRPAVLAQSTMSNLSRPSPAEPTSAAPKPSAIATTNTLKSENVCPINVLTPFFNAWVIRVRVTAKTSLKPYSNKKGEGKLFSFDCCDETGEIRITAFNAECDKFYDLIERDNVYYISKGSIKSANKRFSSLNNEYELTLNAGSVIELCRDLCDIDMPKVHFKFINLADMANMEAGTMVDVIGVVRMVTATESLTSKRTGKELTKREFAIADKSLAEARVTLWNDMAYSFNAAVGQIVALKGVLIGDFRGKTLSTAQSTVMQVEPDIPETPVLRNWFNSHGSNAVFTSLTRSGDGPGGSAVGNNQRFICQITPKLISENTTGGPTYSGFTGMIAATNRSSNHLYKSCGLNGCMKKVTDEQDGLYRCSKCDRSTPTFVWRVMISLNVADATGSVWVTAFQDLAEKLLQRSAPELAQLYEMDQTEYTKVINAVRFRDYYVRVGTRLDDYNGEQRLRTTAYTIQAHKPVERSRRLMAMINILSGQVNA